MPFLLFKITEQTVGRIISYLYFERISEYLTGYGAENY